MKKELNPLHAASAQGDRQKVESLLASGPDLEARDAAGWTALLRAIDKERHLIIELLLKAGANPNAGRPLTRAERIWRSKTDKLETPLSLAARLGDLRALNLLLSAGAHIEDSGCESVACLNTIQGGQKRLAAVKWLLDSGLNPRASCKGTPLSRDAKTYYRRGILEKLAALGVVPPRDRPRPARALAEREESETAERGATDFISFIDEWGLPTWAVIAAKSPVDQTVAAYSTVATHKRVWPSVPIRPARKKDKEMANLVPVIQPKDCRWSLIYLILCCPFEGFEELMDEAQRMSATLKGRALAFFGHDTSGAMSYVLYTRGRESGRYHWEDQSDPSDEQFAKLQLYLPACYPRKEGKDVWLAAQESAVDRIERADIVEIKDF
jgi:hypothetical protein